MVNCTFIQNYSTMQRPLPGEYRSYFQRYIDLVPEGDIISVLRQQALELATFFTGLPAEKYNYRYAPGKWSVKQVLMHITDTERVMCYRALVAARGDAATILCSMDENLYAETAPYADRTIEDILDEFNAVRKATIHLLVNMTEEQSLFTAQNSDETAFTARSLAYIIAGHPLHHVNIIRERYL